MKKQQLVPSYTRIAHLEHDLGLDKDSQTCMECGRVTEKWLDRYTCFFCGKDFKPAWYWDRDKYDWDYYTPYIPQHGVEKVKR